MDELEQEEKKPVMLEGLPLSEICSRISGPDENMTLNDSDKFEQEEKKPVMLLTAPVVSSNVELSYTSYEISSRIPSPNENMTLNDSIQSCISVTEISSRIPSPDENMTPNDSIQSCISITEVCSRTPSPEENMIPNDSVQVIEEIEIDDNTMPYSPFNYSDNAENSTTNLAVENNETDDDFCIVYEKVAPESEVQFIEYRQVFTTTQSSYNRNRLHYSDSPNVSSIPGPNADVTDAVSSITVSTTDSDDDCVAIEVVAPIKKSYAIDNSQQIFSQQSALEDAESKKRKKIECGVCFDGPDDITSDGRNLISTVCGHIFCSECIKAAIKSTKQCPQCRKKLTMKQFHPLYI